MTIQFNRAAITPSNAGQAQLDSVLNQAAGASGEPRGLGQQVEAVKDKTGMVAAHLIPLQQVARDHNCIIGIRPVDRLATELIETGHPTKGFHIKGKSASWGAQAGLICVDQRFSKLENASADRIAKFNSQTRQCIRDGDAAAVPLTISGSRLSSLLQAGVLNNLSRENAEGVRTFTAKAPSGKEYVFEAARKSGGEEAYEIRHDGAPIEVLAPKADAKPLTADYDLLVIGPHLSDVGPQDNLPVPDIAHQVFRDRIDHYRGIPANVGLLDAYLNPKSFYRREDAEIGNASARIRDMIPVINQALVGDGELVVHHNADSGSPATDPDANYPATFALPARIGRFDEICVIANKEELAELVKQAKDSGYHLPLNPLWEKEVSGVRRESFVDACRRLGGV
ncbi:Adenylate cyclase ExoY [Chromobacterium vaccinii]|nr:Adenylate cyclase ExoY [Chromobacterium vaccinii]QND91428.1 Adenylate cyclase ExoY [Chromobacterium vaccinii]